MVDHDKTVERKEWGTGLGAATAIGAGVGAALGNVAAGVGVGVAIGAVLLKASRRRTG